ncbi:MAG: dihydroorotate dehydrogenase, partial [Acidimicrobiia bacterium]
LGVDLGPLQLRTPLVAAAGTVGSVYEVSNTINLDRYGAAVAKSVSPEPWEGRPSPRLGHSDAGMLNGIGIQNPGIDAWLADTVPLIVELPVPVWGSAVAHDVAGFGMVAAGLDSSPVAAVEVNLSCPNLDGMPFALDAGLSAAVIAEVRSATSKPIGAKLSPDAQSVSTVASSVMEAGADWLVMGNTAMGAAIDVATRRPVLSGLIGGYSGAPLRPIAIRCVLEIHRDIPDVPIVGCGGVSTGDHVIEYLLAGASAVGIGTAHFSTPRVADRITRDLYEYMHDNNITSLQELRGAVIPWT